MSADLPGAERQSLRLSVGAQVNIDGVIYEVRGHGGTTDKEYIEVSLRRIALGRPSAPDRPTRKETA